ncbi:MAG: TIR domain-containing protein [Lachnospiraceae bacterium]|nr:TIR domain-containing protein [Lachnospiraceae bacterium]
MINHYNAFISYKHAPEDNRVAEAVHKGLEWFHIPKKIRKKTGINRINRIFRDKDELPITSDLSDSIANALAESDYLIVICSTNTKESAWVPREIEYFLRNHSKRDIFTVLVNGEPYDVIPDILKYEDSVVKDEAGVEHSVRIPIEPLSCDYRMPLGKAKKTELPRLASGILGCAYDELMNRRRQHRIKQITAVFAIILAVLVGFSGYMYYSRDKIHKNYLESLKNQSKYLANESENLLEKERRITALQLALEALPKNEDDDRPVTAEAVRALTNATLAYEGDNGNNINAAWNYPMPGVISYFQLSDDGSKIAIIDELNVIGVWNTEDHNRILYIEDLESNIVGTGFLNNDLFILWNTNTIYCYSMTNGEKVWEYKVEEDTLISKNNLMVNGDYAYFGTYSGSFLKISTASGELQSSTPMHFDPDHEDFSLVESKLSPDGKKIAFRGIDGWNNYSFGVIDLTTKKVEISDYSEEMYHNIKWVDDDSFMITLTPTDMSGSMSFGTMEVFSTDHSKISRIKASDFSEIWSADFVCNGIMIESGFEKLGADKIAYFSGNVVTVYDLDTGVEIYSSNVNNSVLSVTDKDGDGNPLYITEDGGYATPALSFDSDAVYHNTYFTDELRQVEISKGVYVRQLYSHEIIYYGVHVYDEEWTKLCEDNAITGTVSEYCMDENYLAILTVDGLSPYLEVFGLGENALHLTNELSDDKSFNYKLVGIYKDTVYLGYDGVDCYELITLNIKENRMESKEFFKMTGSFEESLLLENGKFYYLYRTEDFESRFAVYDIETGDQKDYELPEDIGFINCTPAIYEEDNTVCVVGREDMFVLDLEDGNIKKAEVPEVWYDVSCFSENSADGVYAVSDSKKILLTDKDGNLKNTINCPGVKPLGMRFIHGDLLVIYNDGGLYWYSPQTGEFVKKAEASAYYNYFGNAYFDTDEENGLIYITMDELVDVVDMESGVEITRILDCLGHHKGRDIFITKTNPDDQGSRIGYYRRYSVEELIKKANDILKGAELSDDMKSRYGIGQ